MGVTALQGDLFLQTNLLVIITIAIYITRKLHLIICSLVLKVILDMNRYSSANVKLMFKILRSDDASDFDEVGLSIL